MLLFASAPKNRVLLRRSSRVELRHAHHLDASMLISARHKFDPHYDLWFIGVLHAKPGKPPAWRRHHPNDTPEFGARAFAHRSEAQEMVLQLNALFDQAIRGVEDSERRMSLELRAQKARQCHERLSQEEDLMLVLAKARGVAAMKEPLNAARLHPKSEAHRGTVEAVLQEYPYVNSLLVGERRRKRLVEKLPDGSWSQPFRPTRKGLMGGYRAPIANGFGLNEFGHFGKIKSEIRRMLLPDWAAILMTRGVRELLDDALARGTRALVWGGYVFWYESRREGWQVKERSGSSDKEDDDALWFAGQIHSVNYGRIVVLPYIKANGEKVRGHTKNAPHDGTALPRPPNEHLLISFEQLDGDLMRELLGEFRYESSPR